MKLNPILTETLEQLITIAKGTSNQWVKFAKENPLTQEMKTRYPKYLKLGNQFVEEQTKELRKHLKSNKSKSSAKKKDESEKPKAATEEASTPPPG